MTYRIRNRFNDTAPPIASACARARNGGRRSLSLALCTTLAVLAAPTFVAPAHATPALDYYKQFDEAERRSIEYDLIWIGGTDAVTNGVVGHQSIAAIKQFEQ